MSQTYIALVGAGGAVAGAVAGALATGLLGVKVARTQLAGQRASQVLDLQEQHRTRHREISRTTYVDLINETNRAKKAIVEVMYCKVANVNTMLESAESINGMLERVSECITMVELEGERVAVNKAVTYWQAMEEATSVLSRLLMQLTEPRVRQNLNSNSILMDVDRLSAQSAIDAINRGRSEFMEAARSALGNNAV
ncbi:hypothetical protein ACL07V_15695 [Streptomyces sp. MB22_4]|uniref:hypothetical protein n=1 Tax=Streptomyces sp. MB22_4 TaxID=3383120 RepID=UPI0039A11071